MKQFIIILCLYAAGTAAATETKAAPAKARSPASTGAAAGDPDRAVEVRGQSRTLSMMLVLKNGKENIDFIKVRKDFSPEIATTPY